MKRILSFLCVIVLMLGCISCTDNDKIESSVSVCYIPASEQELTESELKTTTNILRATYIGNSKQELNTVLLEFKPVEQQLGDIGEETFWLNVCTKDMLREGSTDEKVIYFANGGGEQAYEKGKDYLIIARKYISVFWPTDVYNTLAVNRISMDDLRNGVANFICYDAVMDILWEEFDPENGIYKESDVYKTLPEYIISLVKANPDWKEYWGTEYIRSDDFEYIKSQSEIVSRVKVKSLAKNYSLAREAVCEVKEVISGEIENDEINIQFIPGTVKKGREYIVCIKNQGGFYEITAKNAVQPAPFDWYSWGVVIVAVLVLCGVACFIFIVKRKRSSTKEQQTDTPLT